MVDLTHNQTPPQNGAATRRLLTVMAQRAGVSHEDHDIDLTAPDSPNEEQTSDVELDRIITTVPSSLAGNSHAKDHVKVLTVEPEVVGDVAEDLSTFGFPEKERNKEGWGHTEEVALILKKVTRVTKGNMPPAFMTHTLNEMLWQARLDSAVCLLLLFSEKNSDGFVDLLLKVLNNQLKGLAHKVLIWVADSQSNEGSKVQAKYGVGDQTTLLVVVPSQIPQCVDIFNETNIDEKKLNEALASAQQIILNLESKRVKLSTAKLSQDKSNQEPQTSVSGGKSAVKSNQEPQTSVTAQKSAAKEADTGGINNQDSSDDEVTFGPADAAENDDLDKTVEDEVVEGLGKKGKNKKKKKKNKKNKKKKAKQEDEVAFGEPAEKKQKI